MIRPNRLIYLDNPDRNFFSVETEDQRLPDNIAEQASEGIQKVTDGVSKAVKGVLMGTAKVVDVAANLLDPALDLIVNEGKGAWEIVSSPYKMYQSSVWEGTKQAGKGLWEMAYSPFKTVFYDYPRELFIQTPYDVAGFAGDLTGVGVTWNGSGIDVGMKDRGAIPLAIDLGTGVVELVVSPYTGLQGANSAPSAAAA